MSSPCDTRMPQPAAAACAPADAFSERLELAIEANFCDIYSDISDNERVRVTNGSDLDNYSDPDSDLDLMNDGRKSDASLIEGMGTHGRPSGAASFNGSASNASFHTGVSQYGTGVGYYKQPSNIRKLGRVNGVPTQSTASSARCSWTQSYQSYGGGYGGYEESEASRFSFPDCEDYEDLYGASEGRPSLSSSLTNSPVVAGAGSILKGRTLDGGLPGNPSNDGVTAELGQVSRAQGRPGSSAGDPHSRGGSLARGPLPHGLAQPLQAWAAAGDRVELPAASRSLAASYVGSLTEAKRASPCSSSDAGSLAASYVGSLTEATRASLCSSSDAGSSTPVRMPSEEDVAAFAGVAGSSSGSSSSTCPPKPPKEGTAKSSAYIRKPRQTRGAAGHS